MRMENSWNVLTDNWLSAIDTVGQSAVVSPLIALSNGSRLCGIAESSPLDHFAALRFLLTLLYWKADEADGVEALRRELLAGSVPMAVIKAIEAEADSFFLYHPERPFFQDAAFRTAAAFKKAKSIGELAAEYAVGTGIAHFHHGDDENMRLCLRCVTRGLLRLPAWTQSGGAGLTPSVHGAPPMMALAQGKNLAETLGLNLIALSGEAGEPCWAGSFSGLPYQIGTSVPYLQAFTWNSRIVCLPNPDPDGTCWGCGLHGEVVGPLVFEKNDSTKKPATKEKAFNWSDPAAFYAEGKPFVTKKSFNEDVARSGIDLRQVLAEDSGTQCAVISANPDHTSWSLVVPATNAANNKTFDHRLEKPESFSIPTKDLPIQRDDIVRSKDIPGWTLPDQQDNDPLHYRVFLQAAIEHLSVEDWMTLRESDSLMERASAAFDIFTAIWWSQTKNLKGKSLPDRLVLWTVLRLMAQAPMYLRLLDKGGVYRPVAALETKNKTGREDQRRSIAPRFQRSVKGSRTIPRYPRSLPQGIELERALKQALDQNFRLREPLPVDWLGLCYDLDALIGKLS